MNSRLIASFSAAAIAIIASAPVLAQGAGAEKLKTKAWTPPMTADGQPDLRGVWRDSSATPLERPKQLEGRQFLTDSEVAALKERADRIFKTGDSDYASGDNVFLAALSGVDQFKSPSATSGSETMIIREFDNRTSLIVDPTDGKIPPLTPEAQRRQSPLATAVAAGLSPPAGPEELNNAIRCITPGVPRLGGRYGAGDYGYYEIVQAPRYVVIFSEVMHQTRIIPIDGQPHLPQRLRAWDGDSRGRWIDKTLVVDTTNFSPKSNFMGSAENLHLIERFTRIAPDEIRYQVTVDDPSVWTRPWTSVVRLRRTDEGLYEFACHEGNLPLEGILAGARAQEKAGQGTAERHVK
jgi:hypothetical protein